MISDRYILHLANGEQKDDIIINFLVAEPEGLTQSGLIPNPTTAIDPGTVQSTTHAQSLFP
jgi:ABC-type arginine transport system ATPase subunit